MRVWISPYGLRARAPLSSKAGVKTREGVLLKVESDLGTGYADLFPWPELGDEALAVHLESLRGLRPTRLAARSLELAERDAEARAQKRSLGASGWLKNNALVTDLSRVSTETLRAWSERDFSTVKIKCGTDVDREVGFIENLASACDLRVRLDFNSGSAGFLEAFMAAFPEFLDERIDYAEDPCPYDPGIWNEVRKRWPVALDHELFRARDGEEPSADVLILKPARRKAGELVAWARRWDLALTFTSSMDHPVGIAHGMALAFELQEPSDAKVRDSGFLTLDCYEEEAFAARVPVDGPWMAMPEGTGIGFDELLEEVPWKAL